MALLWIIFVLALVIYSHGSGSFKGRVRKVSNERRESYKRFFCAIKKSNVTSFLFTFFPCAPSKPVSIKTQTWFPVLIFEIRHTLGLFNKTIATKPHLLNLVPSTKPLQAIRRSVSTTTPRWKFPVPNHPRLTRSRNQTRTSSPSSP